MKIKEIQENKQKLNELMDYYKSKLTNMYNRANTFFKKSKLAIDLYNFSDLYDKLFLNDTEMCWDNDDELLNIAINNDMKSTDNFINYVSSNNYFYNNLTNNIINIYKEVKYPFYHKYNNFIKDMSKLNYKEITEIIFSFLNSYDEKIFKYFKNKIKNLEIHCVYDLGAYDGLTINIDSLNKNFILLDLECGKNIYFLKTLFHEFGHAFEYRLQNNSSISLDIYDFPFYEISSSFFEYAFLNYLKDNHICLEDVNTCLNFYFKELFKEVYQVNLLTKNESIIVNNEVQLLEKDIISYGENVQNGVNFYQLPGYGDKINAIFSYIYSTGMVFSIYLYENFKSNPKEFNINFEKSLLSYPLVKKIDAFKNVGINEDELIEGKILKRVLKKISSIE